MARLIRLSDVNQDESISLAEARTLHSLLMNKNTFFMIMLAGPTYIPKMLSFCGNLVEIERIQSYYLFSIKHDAIFPSIFPKSYKWSWPEWAYRW
jgi:hypothetical protein